METGPKISSIESSYRKLAYVDEFRESLRENPGVLRATMELMNQAINDYNPKSFAYRPRTTVRYDKSTNTWLMNEPGREAVRDEHGQPVIDENRKMVYREFDEQPFYYGRATLLVPGEPTVDQETGLQVTVLGRSNRDLPVSNREDIRRVDKTDYFRVDIGGKSYFVKYSTVTPNPGFDEFNAVQQAKEVLADLDFVEVIDAQLGYQDGEKSWYIASWKDLESAGFIPFSPYRLSDDYGKFTERPRYFDLPHEKVKDIRTKLHAAHLDEDVEFNLFLAPNAEKFFLLDITKENNEGIGKPYRPNN